MVHKVRNTTLPHAIPIISERDGISLLPLQEWKDRVLLLLLQASLTMILLQKLILLYQIRLQETLWQLILLPVLLPIQAAMVLRLQWEKPSRWSCSSLAE